MADSNCEFKSKLKTADEGPCKCFKCAVMKAISNWMEAQPDNSVDPRYVSVTLMECMKLTLEHLGGQCTVVDASANPGLAAILNAVDEEDDSEATKPH